MDTFLILRLIFWVGVLGAWGVIVFYGIVWLDEKLDSFLDRWFD